MGAQLTKGEHVVVNFIYQLAYLWVVQTKHLWVSVGCFCIKLGFELVDSVKLIVLSS